MRLNKINLASLVLGGSVLLAGCGGGGSDGGSVLSLSGTAATGAPIAGQIVTATCKTGTATVTTSTDGSYTANIGGGEGPCLLKITLAGGGALYSITSGNGASQTANITPMTNLLVIYLSNVPGMTAASPEAWFALPAARTLLANTAALNTRITADFIPAVKALVPTLSLSTTDFLYTKFTASPTSSTTDADLELLKNSGVVTSTGAPTAATTLLLQTAAANDTPVVSPTGAGS